MTIPSENKKSVYFSELDGLRFFAFFVGFLVHAFYSEEPSILESDLFKAAKEIAHFGIFGVIFFRPQWFHYFLSSIQRKARARKDSIRVLLFPASTQNMAPVFSGVTHWVWISTRHSTSVG